MVVFYLHIYIHTMHTCNISIMYASNFYVHLIYIYVMYTSNMYNIYINNCDNIIYICFLV